MHITRRQYIKATNDIKLKLAQLSDTNQDDWYVVSRARHALELVYRAINNNHQAGEVLTHPFTCVTAVNPIITAGLMPVYADISKRNLTIDIAKMQKMINPNSCAIVAQHTLGLRCNIRRIVGLHKGYKLVIIEDSAHCLGRVSKDADVSVHSFGSEKILKTSFGSALWINPIFKRTPIGKDLIRYLDGMQHMNIYENITYSIYQTLNKIINKMPSIIRQQIKILLNKFKILVTPVMPIELHGKNYNNPKKLSAHLSKRVSRFLVNIESNLEDRIAASGIYNQLNNGRLDTHKNELYVRFPLLADSERQADAMFTELRKKGYEAGKWYRPLIFPGVSDSKYNYKKGSCPIAEECSKLIVNLPTNVSASVAQEIVNEVNNIRTQGR